MTLRLLLTAAVGAFSLTAAVPPAPQLFPNDTIVLLTVPDWAASKATLGSAPMGRLWADPVMKPFRDDFEKKVVAKFIGDMEKDLGIKADEYLPLVQGQLSFAVIQGDWNPANPDSEPGTVLLLDAKDKSAELKTKLAEARQKLSESKKTLKAEKIRDQEFTTVVIEPKPKPAEGAAGPEDADEAGPQKKIEITFGQVDSALLVGDNLKALEKVVAKLTGGSVPTLTEVNAFQASENSTGFRKSMGYAWVHIAPVFSVVEAEMAKAGGGLAAMGIDPRRATQALGLRGLKTLSLGVQQEADGSFFTFAMAVPEAERGGLFKLLATESKDSAPPAFVPADAVDFRRWRLNGQKTWTSIEAILQQVSPQLSGVLQVTLSALGKEKDPSFDFKKSFIGNLGDDYISYAKAPRGRTPQDLANPPGVTLLGAVSAEQLATGLRSTTALLPTGEEPKERDFNGKKIVSITMPATNPAERPKTLEMAASGGYVAFSSDPATLEEYLRSADGGGKSLKDSPALAEAAQRVGGLNTGLFGYTDQRESLRGTWEAVRAGSLSKVTPPGGPAAAEGAPEDFADFKLLPAFDQVAKYFGISVYAGAWDTQGFAVKQYGPNPK
jgi:hypothetical protein